MQTEYLNEVIRIVWPLQTGRIFTTADGVRIEILSPGEPSEKEQLFRHCEISADGTVFKGDIYIGYSPADDQSVYGDCILSVGAAPDSVILKNDGTIIPSVILAPGPVTVSAYGMMRQMPGPAACGGYLSRMEDHDRTALFTRLVVDRLSRKCGELREIFDQCEQNWNNTMYVMLMRCMGGIANKAPYMELARRVRFTTIARERNSRMNVEALLLGTSGLLELYDEDHYVRELKAIYDYLRRKYMLTPMVAGEWKKSRNRPGDHPVLRLAQLSTLFCDRDFLFDRLVKCRTVADLHSLFRAEASSYWSTHYIPGMESGERKKSIGHFKISMLGINFAVPMLFSYGDYTQDETLKDAAIEYLEKIGRDENRIVDGWRERGLRVENAFESQALLQLSNEFCAGGRCADCRIGRRRIKAIYNDEHRL